MGCILVGGCCNSDVHRKLDLEALNCRAIVVVGNWRHFAAGRDKRGMVLCSNFEMTLDMTCRMIVGNNWDEEGGEDDGDDSWTRADCAVGRRNGLGG